MRASRHWETPPCFTADPYPLLSQQAQRWATWPVVGRNRSRTLTQKLSLGERIDPLLRVVMVRCWEFQYPPASIVEVLEKKNLMGILWMRGV